MSIRSASSAPRLAASRHTARKVAERRNQIMALIPPDREFSVSELIDALNFSSATVRRDLRQLQREGFIRREHGFVALAGSRAFEPLLKDPGFKQQIHHMGDEKRRIAAAAVAMIKDGNSMGVAAGTTTAQIVHFLSARKSLTIVTNALNIAMDLSCRKDFTVHLTGGYLSGDWLAMVGPRALDFIATMFTDLFFFSANGIHFECGVTDRHTEEAAINRAMIRQARKRILVADHSKFSQIANCLVCPIREIHTIITDRGATDQMVAPYLALGIEVLRV